MMAAALKPVDQRAESVTMIPIGRIKPAPDNFRKSIANLDEVIEDYPENEREKIPLDTANSVLDESFPGGGLMGVNNGA
jgi:hypothetical protein